MEDDLTERNPGDPDPTASGPDLPVPTHPPAPPALTPPAPLAPPAPPVPFTTFAPPAGSDWSHPAGPESAPSRKRRAILGVIAVFVVVAMAIRLWPAATGGSPDPVVAADPGTVTIVTGEPASIDPARHGDLGSASYVSQLYETLTAVDPSLTVRPALAESWTDRRRRAARDVHAARRPHSSATGRRSRPTTSSTAGAACSTPAHPSPLASLIADVKGARDLLSGASTDVTTLGVRADGDRTVIVDMERGGGDLPAIVSGAPFAVVPPSAGDAEITPDPGHARRQRRLHARPRRSRRLRAGGEPALLGGQAGHRHRADAHGPPGPEPGRRVRRRRRGRDADRLRRRRLDRLRHATSARPCAATRRSPSPTTASTPARRRSTTRKVRQAFAMAVDWKRLASLDEPGSSVAATGMVPAGMPGAPEGDFMPAYDPAGARALLAEAGYASGAALGPISFIANGAGYDSGIVTMLEQNLGVTIDYATMDFQTYQARLATDPPRMWSISWVADYPGPNDFLGVLLGTGSTANQGGWSNPDFDAAITDATSAADPATADRGVRAGDGHRARPGARRSRSATGPRSRSCATGSSARARTASASCASPASPGRTADEPMRRVRAIAVARVLRRGPAARRDPPRVLAADVSFGKPGATRSTTRRSRSPSTSRGPCRWTASSSGSASRTRSDRSSSTSPCRRGPAPTRSSTCSTSRAAATSCPTRRSSRRGRRSRRPAPRRSRRPSRPSATRTRRTTGGPLKGDLMTVHWYAGRPGVREQGAADRRAGRSRTPPTLLGVNETEPVDFYIYGDEASFRDGARARDPRERRRPGARRHPDAVRADHARRDRPAVGGHRDPARAGPPRVRHRRPQPVPVPAALAQRGPRGLPVRGLRVVGPGSRRGRRDERTS